MHLDSLLEQGRIDWARRFDLMQQHSGEHMVSGLIHEAYGYDNVGFHMGSDTITVDLNGPLDEAQLAEIERKTNEKIWEDTEVFFMVSSYSFSCMICILIKNLPYFWCIAFFSAIYVYPL